MGKTVRIEGEFLHLIKGIYKKSTDNIILNCASLNIILLKLGTGKESLLSLLLSNIVCHRHNKKSKKKMHKGRKGRVKLSLLVDDKSAYLENL